MEPITDTFLCIADDVSEACLGPYESRNIDLIFADEVGILLKDVSLDIKQDIFYLYAGILTCIYGITSPRRSNILRDENRDEKCLEMLQWLETCHEATKSAIDTLDTREDGFIVNAWLLEDERWEQDITSKYRNRNLYQWSAAGNINFFTI